MSDYEKSQSNKLQAESKKNKKMATQKCPKCKSKRVRLGYHPTPLLFKLAFTYNLLCDDCNWEFKGFAIPGTVPRKTKKKRSTGEFSNSKPTLSEEDYDSAVNENSEKKNKMLNFEEDTISQRIRADLFNDDTKKSSPQLKRVKKKVRVKLH